MDDRERARRLDADHPLWCIWWGPATREFWGIPLWIKDAAPTVNAPDVDQFIVCMREIEQWYGGPARETNR